MDCVLQKDFARLAVEARGEVLEFEEVGKGEEEGETEVERGQLCEARERRAGWRWRERKR